MVDKKPQSLGEALEGHDLTNSGFHIKFMEDVPPTKLCSQNLDRETALVFGAAVEVHYWYQMYFDDLPIWGMVGEKYQGEGQADKDTDKFIFTHRKLNVAYKNGQVIEVCRARSRGPRVAGLRPWWRQWRGWRGGLCVCGGGGAAVGVGPHLRRACWLAAPGEPHVGEPAAHQARGAARLQLQRHLDRDRQALCDPLRQVRAIMCV